MNEGGNLKARTAFRAISEVAAETGVSQSTLRYWETRFPQLRPLTRAGGRRYYRPEDVALVHRIRALLQDEGYTAHAVARVLGRGGPAMADPGATGTLGAIRDSLRDALLADDREPRC